jgi:hypothetical protein
MGIVRQAAADDPLARRAQRQGSPHGSAASARADPGRDLVSHMVTAIAAAAAAGLATLRAVRGKVVSIAGSVRVATDANAGAERPSPVFGLQSPDIVFVLAC